MFKYDFAFETWKIFCGFSFNAWKKFLVEFYLKNSKIKSIIWRKVLIPKMQSIMRVTCVFSLHPEKSNPSKSQLELDEPLNLIHETAL
jgi:hypothetical protein